MEKIYEVEFMQYANCFNDSVLNYNEDNDKRKYLNVGTDHIFIK